MLHSQLMLTFRFCVSFFLPAAARLRLESKPEIVANWCCRSLLGVRCISTYRYDVRIQQFIGNWKRRSRIVHKTIKRKKGSTRQGARVHLEKWIKVLADCWCRHVASALHFHSAGFIGDARRSRIQWNWNNFLILNSVFIEIKLNDTLIAT